MIHKVFIIATLLVTLSGCTSASLFMVNTLARLDEYDVYQNLSYGDESLNRLDIYTPGNQNNKSSAHRPVVIFFYGGCWGGCETRNKEDYVFVAQALTAHGYIAVLTDYRRYPEVTFEGLIKDAEKSVVWIKNNIHHYGGDANSLFLMGHSAGAHIAAMLTLNEAFLPTETYNSIKGFIGLAGPYDFLPFTKPYQALVFGPEENYPASQPVNFVDGTEPPLLLLYGNNDETVFPVNIKSLAATVNKAGGKVETRLYDNIDHASILGALSIPYQQTEPVLNDIIRFIEHKSGYFKANSTISIQNIDAKDIDN